MFDITICPESLADYRSKYPLPLELVSDEEIPPRPSPQHRHSIAITPSALPLPSFDSPPLASPDLTTASTKLSPFSLVRRASRKGRPTQTRTKSTNDVIREAAVPPNLTPEDQTPTPDRRLSPTPDRRLSFVSLATSSSIAEETPLSNRVSLDRDTTIKEKRGAPRKLRRSAPPKPILPALRVDDEYLLRPSSEFRSRSPSPIPSPKSSPTMSRKSGWRTSLASSFASPVASPTFEMPHELPPRQPRSPSPIDRFPTSIRREQALPPVDRQRKDSLSDSYLGDSENNRLSISNPTRRERSRTNSSIPSPSSPVSTGNLWARALKLGRKGAGSRASSVASSSTSNTSWDMIEGENVGTFEVLRKVPPPPSRPMARRTSSEGSVTTPESKSSVEGNLAGGSTSSPNLSKISEYPESMEQRFTSPYSQSPAAASVESFSRSQGFHTPPVTANSSNTVLALLEGTPSTARRVRSRSALSTTAPINPLDEKDLPSLPRELADTASSRTRSDSNASTTYRSTRSSSRDSLFSSDDTPASSADLDEGDLTGATSSYTDGEEVLHKPINIERPAISIA